MKTNVLFILLLFVGFAKGQTTILYNEPPQPKVNLSIDFLHTEIPIQSIDGASLGLGLNGFYEVIPGVGVQLDAHQSYLTGASLGEKLAAKHTSLDLGGYYIFKQKDKVKRTKVVLKFDEERGDITFNGITGTTTQDVTYTSTYVLVPAKHHKEFGARTGLYHYQSPFSIDDITIGNISSSGAYVGLVFRDLVNIFIKDDTYGVSYTSGGTDIFVDLLFAGYSAQEIAGDQLQPYEIADGSSLGFRLGLRQYQIEKKARTNKKFGLSKTLEIGARPHIGFYVGGSLGLNILKL